MSQAPFIGQHLTHKARNQIAVGMALETSIARMEVTVLLSKQISVIKGYAHRILQRHPLRTEALQRASVIMRWPQKALWGKWLITDFHLLLV